MWRDVDGEELIIESAMKIQNLSIRCGIWLYEFLLVYICNLIILYNNRYYTVKYSLIIICQSVYFIVITLFTNIIQMLYTVQNHN